MKKKAKTKPKRKVRGKAKMATAAKKAEEVKEEEPPKKTVFELMRDIALVCEEKEDMAPSAIYAVLRNGELPDHYHDKKMKELKKTNALPLIKDILLTSTMEQRTGQKFKQTPFFKVIDTCIRRRERR